MKIKLRSLAALTLATTFVIAPLLRADAPTTLPAAEVNSDALRTDIDLLCGDLKDTLSDNTVLTKDELRKAAAPQAIPKLKKIVADLDQLLTADREHRDETISRRAEYLFMLALFGDNSATDRIKTEAASTDPAAALEGKRLQLHLDWLMQPDQAAQAGTLDKVEALAKANPENDDLAFELYGMSRLGPATPDLSKRAIDIVSANMQGFVADKIQQQIAAAKHQDEGQQALLALENKPLTITGKQPDGKDFTTADWKGKVILVDFWATWCGPCVGEIPHVKDMYSKYHDKGLEIVGVSNDFAVNDLKHFTAARDLPWPQLFDAAAAARQQWNPTTLGYGINGIPTMFLIDKKGVLRTVSARENMDELIPKLLAE